MKYIKLIMITLIMMGIFLGVYYFIFEMIYGKFKDETLYKSNIVSNITLDDENIGIYMSVYIDSNKQFEMTFFYNDDSMKTVYETNGDSHEYLWSDDKLYIDQTYVFEESAVLYKSKTYLNNLNMNQTTFNISFVSIGFNEQNNFAKPEFVFSTFSDSKISFEYLNLTYKIKSARMYFYVSTGNLNNVNNKSNLYYLNADTDAGKLQIVYTPFYI